jgi:acyl carrier protein
VSNDGLERIVEIVCSSGKISQVQPDEDFYDAGFSSINALGLLMELETVFDVSIPDDEFVTARTCASLHVLISRLTSNSNATPRHN